MGVDVPQPVVRLTKELEWTDEADVIVVGTGIAGNATAISSAHLGASVIMLEKSHETGGTTAKAAGGALVPNNRFLREQGVDDPKRDFMRFLARLARPLLYNPDAKDLGIPSWEYDLIEQYYDHAAEAWEYLESVGAVLTAHQPGWASYNEIEEDRSRFGRVIFGADKTGRILTGREVVDQMQEKAKELGAKVRLGFEVDGVYVNADGAVVGVRGRQDGKQLSIRAKKAVAFATGGFLHSERYAREYLNGMYVGGCASRSNTGDIIPIAKALGVPLLHMHSVLATPLIFEWALDKDPLLSSNFFVAGDSIITVNKYGNRASNEKVPYNDRTQSHFVWDARRAEYSNFLQFAIFDERTRKRFAQPPNLERDDGNFIPPVGKDSKYIMRAETLEDLAAMIQKRLAGLNAPQARGVKLEKDFLPTLRKTIARFNEFARTGVDEDFHRGQTAIELFTHGGRAEDNKLPNETMFPLADKGPYYATIVAPGAIDTKGGPKVNRNMQILDSVEQPVPGLYGIGNCVASASGQSYWSGGGTWGPYATFGVLAGRSIVKEPVKAIR
jgi:succinate dehydrogenase/fumarate reductase flavoprotein subunit